MRGWSFLVPSLAIGVRGAHCRAGPVLRSVMVFCLIEANFRDSGVFLVRLAASMVTCVAVHSVMDLDSRAVGGEDARVIVVLHEFNVPV